MKYYGRLLVTLVVVRLLFQRSMLSLTVHTLYVEVYETTLSVSPHKPTIYRIHEFVNQNGRPRPV